MLRSMTLLGLIREHAGEVIDVFRIEPLDARRGTRPDAVLEGFRAAAGSTRL
jgi:hypothetical protein